MIRKFGTDGMRGLYDPTGTESPINGQTAEDLGLAYASMVAEQTGTTPLIVIGGDTRPSTPELVQAATAGAVAAGAEVLDVGIAPTPVIAWIARSVGGHAIDVTASHNPAKDNGLKIFAADAIKPDRETLAEIEARLRQTESGTPQSWLRSGGKASNRPELARDYVSHLVEKLGGKGALDGRLVVIDGAHGAARGIAPEIYERLGAEVVRYACNCGVINDGCGAADLDGVQAFLACRPDLTNDPRFIGAFASDGDADRVMGVDRYGRIIDGNHWMQWLADDPSVDGIVGTEYTNSATRQAVAGMGVDFYQCDNGDSHVTDMLFDLTASQGSGYSRGGEFTGHMIDLAHLPSGDGIYMGAALAADLARNGSSLADTYDGLELWPERLQNIELDDNKDARAVRNDERVREALAVVEEKYQSMARVVLRASGTQSVVRVWAEARERVIMETVVTLLSQAVELAATETNPKPLTNKHTNEGSS